MRLQLFDPIQEVRKVPFPWDHSIVFHIRRSGATELAKHRKAHQRKLAAAAMGALKPEDLDGLIESARRARIAATAKSNGDETVTAPETLADITEDVDSVQDFMLKLMATGAGSSVLEMVMPGEADFEGVVSVVARVDGLKDEQGNPCEWTRELGLESLRENADILPPWLEEQSDLIEADFQKYLESVRGNSVPSSASSTGAVGGETP